MFILYINLPSVDVIIIYVLYIYEYKFVIFYPELAEGVNLFINHFPSPCVECNLDTFGGASYL